MKNSREFFTAVNKKFGPMPFNLRNFDSETKAKMGVVECVTHKLVVPFQVLYEKEGKLKIFFTSNQGSQKQVEKRVEVLVYSLRSPLSFK